jgi:hypothetical protein
MPLTPVQALKINELESSALGRVLGALEQFDTISNTFLDFTTSLVRDVIRTVTDSTMEQLEAYADLVSKVAGTLQDYEVRMVGSATDFDIRALDYLNEVVRPSLTTLTSNFAQTPAGPPPYTNLGVADVDFGAKVNDAKTLFAGVSVDFGAGPVAFEARLTLTAGSMTFDPAGTFMKTLDLHQFCAAKLRKDVKASYDKLVMILKLGMQKIVITEGEVKTSLTYHLDSSDSDELTSTQVEQDILQRTTSWGVSGGFGGSRKLSGKLGGNIISRSLGGSISGGVGQTSNRTKIKINVMNEKKTAVTNSSVDITGSVLLRFKSDYFPSVDPTTIQPA